MPSRHSPIEERPNLPIERFVGELFQAAGWKVLVEPQMGEERPDLVAERKGEKLVIEIKRASEGRRDRIIPLLSQAVLEVRRMAGQIPGRSIPVAIVVAQHIPDSVAKPAREFARRYAPDVAIGLVDLDGWQSFMGHGLEKLNAERRKENGGIPAEFRSNVPQLFSDLNQWMLKVVLAPRIPVSYLSAPRASYQGSSQLAQAAGVSEMSAFRFVSEFSREGFLERSVEGLRIVRARELMNRWLAASQRRVLEIPARWILNRKGDALANALRAFVVPDRVPRNAKNLKRVRLPRERPRICLGLFAAAEALGLGFVHGVQPYLYLERMSEEALEKLGLSTKGAEQNVDVFVRIPGNRESVFRGAVVKDQVAASDVIQVWLDVSHHPARGKDQADLIWRRVLGPALNRGDES
jgi:hypothetical protein